jgi:hypothetical protein
VSTSRAYPSELRSAELKLLRMRPKWHGRDPEKPEPNDDVPVGVGLSGGGIRSATFCLGVFQALARLKQLGQIDFLSTVSGGGYFGSAYGRLFTRAVVTGVAQIEAELGGPTEGRFVGWLRENGRYLSPRGGGDLILALTATLRGWAAVQVLLALAVVAIFSLLQLVQRAIATASPDAWARYAAHLEWHLPGDVPLWGSAYAVVPVLFLGLTIAIGWAYWILPSDSRDARWSRSVALGILLALAGGLGFGQLETPSWFRVAGVVVAVLAAAALLAAVVMLLDLTRSGGLAPTDAERRAAGQDGRARRRGLARLLDLLPHGCLATEEERIAARDRMRNRYSFVQKCLLALAAGAAAFVVVDSFGQTLYALSLYENAAVGKWFASILAPLGAAAALVGRIVPVFRRGEGKKGPIRGLIPVAATIVATIVLLILLTGADTLSHAIVATFECPTGVPQSLCRDAPSPIGACCLPAPAAASPCCAASSDPVGLGWPALMTGFLGVLALVSGWSLPLLNASTQLPLYRARLARAYLGASNPQRHAGTRAGSVLNVLADDDTAIESYYAMGDPTRARQLFGKGTPLHLINCTINETIEGRSQVEQNDRKGVPLAVGPCGMSAGVRHHVVRDVNGVAQCLPPPPGYRVFEYDSQPPGGEPMTLGQWLAISGAAFSTGIGARTSFGMSVLAGLANVRLGYWWDSRTKRDDRFWRKLLPVQLYLLDEILARFRGTAERFWNLSDGGHFENLGGYELLRRRLPLVVLVDAEADPDFTFPGLADLVMKARVDLDADIHFLDEAELDAAVEADVRPRFGTLDQLRRGAWTQDIGPLEKDAGRHLDRIEHERFSWRHAALARVTYAEPAQTTWLVYLKASMTGDEPPDVLQYHRENTAFPHQTTGDQFFDERQWESYRKLGEHVAAEIFAPAADGAGKWTPNGFRVPPS